ncbi:RNA polymerase sigma-70 factor, ECF subfamily [Prauserella marina]|uniref:RNA polymerase sigma-70 factor, ECF subfamily n=1 Tax=Prauserella marina TaxID=530584 RepID=A0A1G6I1H5_9PSEU|nr:RNA polymerase sigma-70 factor [Prauserella marina]PWV85297.1 RNA polymerase ECF family sigma subunit [Prauserella marina]SDC00300.1 RNA polymerase sigma-70 factor, ECF subfamily [Prauserella marina]
MSVVAQGMEDGKDGKDFEAARPRLFAIAYRMLGSAAEAEDAVQDTFLRWTAADRSDIEVPVAWLTKVLGNLCLTRLGSARARRESYVGPWLPEPVATEDSALGPLDTAEQRDSVSMAFLLLLERLNPAERAVFVLREAFEYAHREIAEILDLTEANSQQLYHRARRRVAEERARFPSAPRRGKEMAQRFLSAARGGDLEGLRELLAADVVSWADGGGKTHAARKPVRGLDKVVRYLGWMSTEVPGLAVTVLELNGQPGLLATVGEQPLLAVVLDIADGKITTIRIVNNPDKLVFLNTQVRRNG